MPVRHQPLRLGKTGVVAIVLVLFVGSVGFLLYRTGVISIGESARDWPVPEPDLSEAEPRVQAHIRDARQAVLDDPSSSDAWGRYAVALDAHLLNDAAAEAYGRAHQLDPDSFEWAYHHAFTRFYQSAPPEEVVALLNEAIALNPEYAPAYVRLGDVFVNQGDNEQARDAYEKAIELDGNLAVAHRSLGQVLLTLGEAEEAVRHLERADRLVPNDTRVAAALSQGYMRLGEMQKAADFASRSKDLVVTIGLIDPLRDAVDDSGVSTRLCDERAKRRMARGKFEEAIPDLRIVLEKYPNDPYVHVRLGTCYQETGQLDLAVQHFVAALQVKDDLVEAHARLGEIYWQRDWPRCAFHYQRLIELSPPRAGLHTNAAIALAQSGDTEAAMEHFEKAVELAPEDPDAHSDLARARALSGDLDGAIEAANAAVALEPNHANANLILGQIYDEREQFDEAIEHYRRVVRADPTNPVATRLMELTARDR